MLARHRTWLLAIVELVDDFAAEPSVAGLTRILDELAALIADVQGTGYEGIELTILRLMHAIMSDEVADVVRVALTSASLAALTAECNEQAGAMRALAREPKAVAAFRPDPEDRLSPASAITTSTYFCEGNQLWLAQTADTRLTRLGLSRTLVMFRDAGVTFFDFSRTAALTRVELTSLCNAARKSFMHYPELAEMICNLEVRSLGSPPIFARLVVTKARTQVFLSYETRSVPQTVPVGVTFEQVTRQLCQEFGIREFRAEDGGVWTAAELLEIQAAFTKIPAEDRGALENLVVLRRKLPVADPNDTKQTAASYHQRTHTFTVLDRCFTERKAFVGGGLDSFPYCHMTILHEIGHVMEPWFHTAGIPDPERLRALKDEHGLLDEQRKAAGQKLNSGALTGPALLKAQNDYAEAVQKLAANEFEYAVVLSRSLHGDGCLTAFVTKAQELRLQPVTTYSWEEWPDKPYEFWAECYSLFLVDPAALEYVSPPLYRWFRDGGYRVRGAMVPPAALPPVVLTAEQTEALSAVRSKLDAFCFEFEKATAVSPAFLTRIRERLARMTRTLNTLQAELGGLDPELIECVIVDRALRALSDAVAAPLAVDAPVALTLADLPVLKGICERERGAFASLAGPAQLPVPAATKRVAARSCTIEPHPAGDTVAVTGDAGTPLLAMTSCLVSLRERGIRGIRLVNCDALSPLEITWLCNAARRVHAQCGSRLGIVIDTAITVPLQQTVYYVRFVFSDSGKLRIRLVETKAAGAAASLPSLAQAQDALRTEFGIAAVTGVDGAAWTSAELVQVCDAFALLPVEDRHMLRGCTLVRATDASGTQPWDAVAEARRRGTYHPDTHTFVFIDTVFTDTRGFIGTSTHARPRSLLHILRIVAYAALHHSGPGALRRFLRYAAELGVHPMTEDLQTLRDTDQADFFAEAYSLCWNTGGVLQWVSPALGDWLARGGYRSDAL